MVISKYMINAQYNTYQYAGAAIVAVGIVVVLAPTISGGGSILWAMVMMVSCVPMTLSSVYKVLLSSLLVFILTHVRKSHSEKRSWIRYSTQFLSNLLSYSLVSSYGRCISMG